MVAPRQFPRLANDWHLKYKTIERECFQKKPLNNFMLNVTGGGLCFTTKEEFEPETLLAVEMQSQTLDSPVIAIVKTVLCEKRRLDAMYDLCCEFWWIGWKDDKIQQQLSEYIKTNTEKCEGEACVIDDF